MNFKRKSESLVNGNDHISQIVAANAHNTGIPVLRKEILISFPIVTVYIYLFRKIAQNIFNLLTMYETGSDIQQVSTQSLSV